MLKINIKKIKELRDITGAGITECKKALIKTKQDLNLAIDYIRKYLKLQSIKKLKNITKEGLITDYVTKDFGILLEINCQTDFITKSKKVINFTKDIIKYITQNKQTDINIIRKIFNKKRMELIGLLKENIFINRLGFIKGEFIGKYIHHNKRLGVIIQSNINNKLLMKQIAMHIAMLKPDYINTQDIPIDIIDHEYKIQKNIIIKTNKPQIIIDKIVEGRVKKFINNITLYNQKFLLDNNKTVKKYLNENNMKILKFICFELGSNIIKN
ncbi:translation elongation factor Ts [Enterobacteriaceae endosymbiont of Donacia semicuprea]|uniref:translation elongation factor Ts n=1 Tax=Enterobacteriaceae endosymbiont of Donacia semicuprea TaxID=2675783 RepID=UPI001448BE7B|nr:translation elongation factor Ts [Enterobacteriaceae endosymbiont of Donacia semicuprea]QJC32895.1 translation elongation factor Ts [Enterobacteriaceae endosymbiont of Donacia semicuprea]